MVDGSSQSDSKIVPHLSLFPASFRTDRPKIFYVGISTPVLFASQRFLLAFQRGACYYTSQIVSILLRPYLFIM